MQTLPKPQAPQDGRQSETALAVARGTRRLLRRLNFSAITELPLLSGPRAQDVRRRILTFGEARDQLFIERVFGQKHIVLRRDRDMGGALRDQPIGERRGFVLRAIQYQAPIA